MARLHLKNGSSLSGKLKSADAIRLNTGYGVLNIPVSDIYHIRWAMSAREEPNLIRTRNGQYAGYIQHKKPILIDTGYGVLQVPAKAISEMSIWRSAGHETFDGTLSRWQTKGGKWTIENGHVVTRASSNWSNQLWLNERLHKHYDVEVSLQGGQNIGLVWHARTPLDAAALFIQNGRLYAYDGPSWINRQIPGFNNGRNYVSATTYRLRLQVRGNQTTIFLNQKKLGTVTTRRSGGYLGLLAYNGTATFDDFIVRR